MDIEKWEFSLSCVGHQCTQRSGSLVPLSFYLGIDEGNWLVHGMATFILREIIQ